MSNTDQPETDITSAFEELRREVSLTRAALEGLTAARERIPDYSPTLGQIAERLKVTAAAVECGTVSEKTTTNAAATTPAAQASPAECGSVHHQWRSAAAHAAPRLLPASCSSRVRTAA